MKITLTGDLDITADVRLTGHSSDDTVIDGSSIDRVFHIIGAAIHVEFYHLVIQNGYSAGTGLDGSGVFNGGTATLDSITFYENTA